MTPKIRPKLTPTLKVVFFACSVVLLALAAWEALVPGWGSGNWLGRLSEKWAIFLTVIYLAIAALLALAFLSIYSPNSVAKYWERLLVVRAKLGALRWAMVALAAVFPAWFVFFSPWGGLFTGIFFRVLLFALSLTCVAFLLVRGDDIYVTWNSLLVAGLSIGVVLVFAESLVLVSDYPFALHWSEGNRLWDYSVIFGRERYNYPGTEPIFAWIDPGRQTLWGLPFLIPGVPIWAVRLWSAILVTVPYAILGWVVFRPTKASGNLWIAAGFWALLFLNQGPIYTPLVLAAILVAIARRQIFWIALPLIFLAGHYAGISRFTWRFAPGIWVVILALGDAVLVHGQLLWRDWLRAAAYGLAGIWSKGLPILVGIVISLVPASSSQTPVDPGQQSIETLQGIQTVTTQQPFLFERLFPNPIYAPGILLGLAIAVFPLIALLVNLIRKGVWKTVFWQRLATVLGLGALLVVGVIASAKVGGGTDLHNMDMFLVGVVLVAGLAWTGGFADRFSRLIAKDATVRWLLAGMILVPTLLPLGSGKPLELPSQERTEFVLTRIQDVVACARQHGEVLFMDQRQLITFGQMGDLPLVVDYEKKYVMDQALAENEDYFVQFREDLAAGRFSLIVSEREAILYKETDVESIGDSLIEENNAWVTWVTTPLLRYYESIADYKDAAIELFMPIGRSYDCS